MSTTTDIRAGERRVPAAWITSQPQVSPERLPVSVDTSPSRLGAMIVCAAGVLVLTSSWQTLGHTIYEPEPVVLVTATVIVCIALGLIAGGLMQLYRRQTVMFGETGVEVCERSVTGTRRWSADYREFAGVLQREHTVHRKNSTTVYQIIQLLHADPARDLPLYVVRGDALPRQQWEALAKRLRLPALQLDDSRIVSRPAGAIDAPLAEQVRAGHLRAGDALHVPPPASITVRNDHSDVTWIELRHSRLPTAAYVIVALVLLPFLATGFLHPGALPMAGVAVAVLAGIGWVRWKDATSPRSLSISEARVEAHDGWRWNSADATALDVAAIEGVRVYRKSGSLVVAIESDVGSIHFGHGLARSDLTWLRDVLIARIAAVQARRGRSSDFAERTTVPRRSLA